MKTGRSTGPTTAEQKARWDLIRELGCIACRLRWPAEPDAHYSYPEIHHLTTGGKHGQKRRGHDFTVGLCTWHHTGKSERAPAEMTAKYGPSYGIQPLPFRIEFGRDDVLLDFQNELIAIYQRNAA